MMQSSSWLCWKPVVALDPRVHAVDFFHTQKKSVIGFNAMSKTDLEGGSMSVIAWIFSGSGHIPDTFTMYKQLDFLPYQVA